MTISELGALLVTLEKEAVGNAPVVLDTGGPLRLVRGASVERLVQLQPRLYVRAEEHKDARPVVVIKI